MRYPLATRPGVHASLANALLVRSAGTSSSASATSSRSSKWCENGLVVRRYPILWGSVSPGHRLPDPAAPASLVSTAGLCLTDTGRHNARFIHQRLCPRVAQEYPRCWKTNELCSSSLLDSVSYSQIAGIIVGMVGLGFFADRIGRRVGSITTASIMLIGGILLTASDGPTSHGVFVMYVISQVSERAAASMPPSNKHHDMCCLR